MKKLLVLLIFFYSKKLYGQERSHYGSDPEHLFTAYLPKIKYEFGVMQSINAGLSFIDYTSDDIVYTIPVWEYHGPFIETGLGFKEGERLLCSKIGYEAFLFILGGRASLIHYTDFSTNQVSFRPEAGLSLFSFFTFTYGYNINFHGKSTLVEQGHFFSLNLAYCMNRK